MASVVIQKTGAVTVFVGRYPDLATAQNMATIKAGEYGVGTTAWYTSADLPYVSPSVAGATQSWTK